MATANAASTTTGSTSNVLKGFAFAFIVVLVPFLIGGTRTLPLRGESSSRPYEAAGERVHTYHYCDNDRRSRSCQGFSKKTQQTPTIFVSLIPGSELLTPRLRRVAQFTKLSRVKIPDGSHSPMPNGRGVERRLLLPDGHGRRGVEKGRGSKSRPFSTLLRGRAPTLTAGRHAAPARRYFTPAPRTGISPSISGTLLLVG